MHGEQNVASYLLGVKVQSDDSKATGSSPLHPLRELIGPVTSWAAEGGLRFSWWTAEYSDFSGGGKRVFRPQRFSSRLWQNSEIFNQDKPDKMATLGLTILLLSVRRHFKVHDYPRLVFSLHLAFSQPGLAAAVKRPLCEISGEADLTAGSL